MKNLLKRLLRMPDAESGVARMHPVTREPTADRRARSELLVVGQYDGHVLTFARNIAYYDATSRCFIDASSGEPLREPFTHWALASQQHDLFVPAKCED